MGPLASHLGGQVIASGHYEELMKQPQSLTGQYLSGALQVMPPRSIRKPIGFININGCSQNNLKNIDVAFPLQVLCVVTGVSGSGKSSLISHTLYPILNAHF
jgi:excinuclease ABC subunit A